MIVEQPHSAETVLKPVLTVRRMTTLDLEAVVHIERTCFPSHWSVNAFLNELSNRSAHYFVACWEEKVVGYCGMWVIMDEAHITTLGVLPEYRRKKVGELLLWVLLVSARQLGARRATLEVRKSNLPAIRLYEKYRFRQVAIRKGYYAETGEDALVMWVTDIHSSEYTQHLQGRYQSFIEQSPWHLDLDASSINWEGEKDLL